MPDFEQVPARRRPARARPPRPAVLRGALGRLSDTREHAGVRGWQACWRGAAPGCASPFCRARCREGHPPLYMPRAQQQRRSPVHGLAARPVPGCSRAAGPTKARAWGRRAAWGAASAGTWTAAAAQRAVALRARPGRRARSLAAPPVRPRAGVPRRPPALPRCAPAPGAAHVEHGSERRGRAVHVQQAPGARGCVSNAAGCEALSGALVACWRAACVTCMHARCGMHARARRHLQGRARAGARPSARAAWHA